MMEQGGQRQDEEMESCRRIRSEERETILVLVQNRKNQANIAKALGRNQSNSAIVDPPHGTTKKTGCSCPHISARYCNPVTLDLTGSVLVEKHTNRSDSPVKPL